MRLTQVVALAFVVTNSGFCANPPLLDYLKTLRGKQFTLRAHGELFGPSHSAIDTRRIQEATISANGGSVQIGDNTDWQGTYFISAAKYVFKDVALKGAKDEAQIKLWTVATRSDPRSKEDEIRLDFQNLSSLSIESFNRCLLHGRRRC